MNQSRRNQKPITAREFMERLEKDPQYIARREKLDAIWRQAVEQNKAAAAPIIDDLKNIGISFQSIDDLRRSGVQYKAAVPILLKWLPIVENRDIIALGKLKARETRPQIESFLRHPKSWVRKEATKALKNLNR